MIDRVRDIVRRVLARAGFELRRLTVDTSHDLLRARVLAHAGVDVIADVGANRGQFAQGLRRAGYRGRIVSFEPQSVEFALLEAAAAADPLWEVRRVALGSAAGEATLNVGGDSVTSSLLQVESHLAEIPAFRVERTETVRVERLDDLVPELLAGAVTPALKVDAQGLDLEVLRGAPRLLARAAVVEVELNLVDHYEGAATYGEVVDALHEAGFRLAAVGHGYVHPPSGHMTYVDGIFVRA